MRNTEKWAESKYVWHGGRLRASRDPLEVGVGSRLTADRVAEFYSQYIPRFARGRLGDLGCGKAPLYGLYRPYVDNVICVDWPQTVHETSYVDFEVDLEGSLPFGDNFFDTLLLSDVLEHVPNPENLWLEMSRVLSPGGHLLMNAPFLYGVHEEPYDFARYTSFALSRFAQRAGLRVVLLEPVGGSLHVLADFLAKHAYHIPVFGAAFAKAIQGLAACADRTPVGRFVFRKTAARFPLGYFLVAVKIDFNNLIAE